LPTSRLPPLAQRILDSINFGSRQGGQELVEGSLDLDALIRTDDLLGLGYDTDVQVGPQEGEAETAASADELHPLSLIEASEILGTGHLDPTTMVAKLLAFEGRALRSRASGRPIVGDGR
jgi:hypothetical protein